MSSIAISSIMFAFVFGGRCLGCFFAPFCLSII